MSDEGDMNAVAGVGPQRFGSWELPIDPALERLAEERNEWVRQHRAELENRRKELEEEEKRQRRGIGLERWLGL